jgi:outer membrane protein
MKNRLLTIGLLSLASLTQVSADFIGFEAGAGYWNAKTTGSFQKGTTSIDLEKDLGYGSNNGTNTFYALFEHPLPLIPNFKIQHTQLDESSSSTVSRSLNFKGTNYAASTQVNSSYDLTQTDFIAYYEILDNWINLDLGLNIKYLDGSVELNSIAANTREDFSVYIPMGYAKAQVDLPFTGFSVESDLSYIAYSSNHFYDAKIGVQYETSMGLGAELGYRQLQLKIDDLDDFSGDITTKGVYASLFYHF